MWFKRLVIFLIRKRFGLKKNEKFRFINQKSNAMYYFNSDRVMKLWQGHIEPSRVSLNWLLDDECKIVKVIE